MRLKDSFKSHKIVRAAKILTVVQNVGSPGAIEVVNLDNSTEIVPAPDGFFSRGIPSMGDYLVEYEPDGYLSWSPKDKFEDGYINVTAIKTEGKEQVLQLINKAAENNNAAAAVEYAQAASSAAIAMATLASIKSTKESE